ncbi:hypothetical protein [Sorangium sp. So ce887]|uniref:hypothetical protein n=1 Tax=Sorangium sp. So ce887 TaxID=3133324 RepID=UPI003F5E8545
MRLEAEHLRESLLDSESLALAAWRRFSEGPRRAEREGGAGDHPGEPARGRGVHRRPADRPGTGELLDW